MQWAVHTDPAYWKEPLEFRPDRFLTEDGTFFKPESFLPFQTGNFIFFSLFPRIFSPWLLYFLYQSSFRFIPLRYLISYIVLFKGKRVCVGEELARMILFLFAGRILRSFVISVPPDETVDLEGECGITLVPKPHRLTFAARPINIHNR